MIYGSTWATCWWERERIWDLKWDIFLALFPAFLWLVGICLWLIISSRMNGDKRIFISSVIKRENIFQNSLVDRCLDKIHKHYFRNLKFIRKSSHTIKSTSVKFMGGEQWQCDFMTGFFLRSCWWGVVSFNRTGSVDDQWSRSDLYECQFFFSVYSHVLWGKGCIVWYCGVSGWDLNWDIFPAPSSWFEREIYPNLKFSAWRASFLIVYSQSDLLHWSLTESVLLTHCSWQCDSQVFA